MQRAHVDRVDVGPLLAVDLDVDEEVVHDRRGAVVLEALMRHHVAPMAGGIADREQDRLARALGFRQRLVAPGPPVHRVVLVLEEIGARLAREPVRSAVLAVCSTWGVAAPSLKLNAASSARCGDPMSDATHYQSRSDTICALASGAGRAAVAVIRVSGRPCRDISGSGRGRA